MAATMSEAMATATTSQQGSRGFSGAIHYFLFDYWEEEWNPRSRDYAFVHGGPWKMIAAMAFYIYFSARLGPALMKNRPAFELRRAMLLYNITTVLLNTYFFVLSVYYLNFGLELLDFKFPSNDPADLTELDFLKTKLVYFYILTKLFDLLDTLFFVLRKKNNQITGLHLYHHSVVPTFGWLILKLTPTANCLGLFPLVNTLVHIIMYSYYALSSLGPSVQPYLWWKKYITQIQLAQFALYGLYAIFFFWLQEGYPIHIWGYIGFPQPFLFFYLFYRFYKSSYDNNKSQHKTTTMKKTIESRAKNGTSSDVNNNMDKKEL